MRAFNYAAGIFAVEQNIELILFLFCLPCRGLPVEQGCKPRQNHKQFDI